MIKKLLYLYDLYNETVSCVCSDFKVREMKVLSPNSKVIQRRPLSPFGEYDDEVPKGLKTIRMVDCK